MRRYEVGTAAAIMLIAAVAMFDSRRGALPDPTGTAPGGLGAGFYPFWAAALIFVAGAVVLIRVLNTPQPAQGVFRDRTGVVAVVALVIPMIAATVAIPWLGMYITTAAYMGFFARTIGKYAWYWTVAIAAGVSAALYLAFEVAFKVGLPKSIFSSLVPF